jgi:hypothetical protein
MSKKFKLTKKQRKQLIPFIKKAEEWEEGFLCGSATAHQEMQEFVKEICKEE